MRKDKVIVVVLLAFVLVGGIGFGGGQKEKATQEKGTTKSEAASKASVSGYKEAPQLTEMVKAGKLPPLVERLPKEPAIVATLESIGQYGGEIRRVYTGPTDNQNLRKFDCYEPVWIIPAQDGSLTPGLITKWEILNEGRTIRVHLREGVKWSDGVPLTVDDMIYVWESYKLSKFPLQNVTTRLSLTEKMEKIDDYTCDIQLSKAYPLAVWDLTHEWPEPKHYLKQFDPRLTAGKELSQLDEAWAQQISPAMIKKPTVSAWKVVEYIPQVRIVAERNPYFWGVDSAGNQLPYVDRVVFKYVADPGTIPGLVKAGEVDMQSRHMTFRDYRFYKVNEKFGNFRTAVLGQTALGPAMRFNYGAKDLDLRKLFWEKDFRVALSLGIDREELNRAIYEGQAEPWSLCPLRNSPLFPGEKYAKLYTEYDPKRANQILDKLGLKDLNGDGFREFPNTNKTISLIMDIAIGGAGGPVEAIELVAEQWKKIGIKATANAIERSLVLGRRKENTFEITVWKHDAAINPLLKSTYWTTLVNTPWGTTGLELTRWYDTKGKEGVEPPEFIKKINDLYMEVSQTIDENERVTKGKQLAALYPENVWALGTTTYVDLGIVNMKLANVPASWTSGDMLMDELSLRPCQFYYKR